MLAMPKGEFYEPVEARIRWRKSFLGVFVYAFRPTRKGEDCTFNNPMPQGIWLQREVPLPFGQGLMQSLRFPIPKLPRSTSLETTADLGDIPFYNFIPSFVPPFFVALWPWLRLSWVFPLLILASVAICRIGYGGCFYFTFFANSIHVSLGSRDISIWPPSF